MGRYTRNRRNIKVRNIPSVEVRRDPDNQRISRAPRRRVKINPEIAHRRKWSKRALFFFWLWILPGIGVNILYWGLLPFVLASDSGGVFLAYLGVMSIIMILVGLVSGVGFFGMIISLIKK